MASDSTYKSSELSGMRVVNGAGDKRVGKVARLVFHPTAKRCVGFIVKRPDLALMFHRPDLFVSLDAFRVEGGEVVLSDEKDATGPGAIKRLGLDWNRCVMWEGMVIVTESGEELGHVGDIVFSRTTGKVVSISVERGATARALVGRVVVPAELIRGFRTGVGSELAQEWAESDDGDYEPVVGAIVVSDDVDLSLAEGGVAEAAGKQAAVVTDAARRAADDVKPKVDKVAKKTGEALNKGVYATGRQIGRARGMFAAFKEEYDKASGNDRAQSK